MMAMPSARTTTPMPSHGAEPPVTGLQFEAQRRGRTRRSPAPCNDHRAPREVAITPTTSVRINRFRALISALPLVYDVLYYVYYSVYAGGYSVKRNRMEPRTARGQPTLTRRAIVDAALASADAGGLEAITFRRLAADLGVTPMALYRHVATKQALLDALSDRIFEELKLPAEEAADWRDQLRELARTFRRLLLSHPAIAALDTTAPALSHNQARAVEALLRTLDRAGFSPHEAGLLEIEFETFVRAHVRLESRGRAHPASDDERTARLREIRARLLTLPPDEFPHTVEVATRMSEPLDPDSAFEFALDLLIGGFEKALERHGRQRD